MGSARYVAWLWLVGFLTVNLDAVPRAVVSQSGQFTVVGRPNSPPPFVPEGKVLPPVFTLDPNFLVISAERVKGGIYSLLRLPNTYQSRIQLTIVPGQKSNFPASLISTLYSDGWKFQLNLGEEVEETKLTHALVQVVLMEIAQRNATRTPELPPWLVEGVTENVMLAVGPSLIVRGASQSGTRRIASHSFGWKVRMDDSLRTTRELLRTNIPPTYTQLSFAKFNFNDPRQREVYGASSHLFVNALLNLPDGPSLFVNFLQKLPTALNWQTAFFRTYGIHFQRPLDVEKWWALTLFEFTSRDHRQAWTPLVSLARLESQLITHSEWHSSTNALPSPRALRLQELLRNRHYDFQKRALVSKLDELQSLQVHLAPDVAELAERYREVITTFVEARTQMQTHYDVRLPESSRYDQIILIAERAFGRLDAQGRTYRAKLESQSVR